MAISVALWQLLERCYGRKVEYKSDLREILPKDSFLKTATIQNSSEECKNNVNKNMRRGILAKTA